MTAARYVVLGLAAPRAAWFRAVSQWANSGALPVEFVKCVGADELRARLLGNRPYSAVLVDGALPCVDRDLLVAGGDAGCPVIVVDDTGGRRDWQALGAAAVVGAGCDRAELLGALTTHARLVRRADVEPVPVASTPAARSWTPWRATVVTVLGPGGTGASTAAAAAAQGLAADARAGGSVLLADLCRRAEQAMLHDAGRATAGVQELTEAHRNGRPDAVDTRSLAVRVPARGYDLLCGLRQPRFWPALRPAAFGASFGSLTAAYRYVVVDTDDDLESEADAGSRDVEERNVMARTALVEADVVVVVGEPSMKGLHSLTRLVHDLTTNGVPVARILPVLNRSPRSPRTRAVMTATLAEVVGATGALRPPLFLPVRDVDRCFQEGTPLPAPLPTLLVSAILHTAGAVDRQPGEPPAAARWQPVRPGTLGSWDGREATG